MKLFLFITTIFILSMCLVSAEVSEEYVKQVIDGNTIQLSTGEFVRYIGVRLPRFPIDLRIRELACEFNKRSVEGRKVKLEFDEQKKSPEGYLLAYVYCGDLFVNAEIIRLGYGLIELYSPNTKYAEHLIKLEQEARSARRGLWSKPSLLNTEMVTAGSSEERMTLIERKIDDLSTKLDRVLELVGRLQIQPKDTHDASMRSSNQKTSGSKKDDVNLEQKETDIVYVTKSGKKYHKLGCRFLTEKSTPMTIQEAKQKGLEPCKLCFSEEEPKTK